MTKQMRNMIIGLSIVFGGIIAYNLFKSLMMKWYFAHYEPPAVSVSAVKAKKEPWQAYIRAVGNFMAQNGVEVNSQVAGNIVGIHFRSGQFVKKDELLVDIDDTVDQASLRFNQSELALQEINYKRQADLMKRGATSGSNFDEANAKLSQAKSDVERIQASIEQKHIKAPFTGQLGISKVNLGQYITPGQTAIVSLQSLDPLFLEFFLPEQLLPKLHVNQSIRFSVEQNPDMLFTGKITAINSKVDPNTHNIEVQATVPNCAIDALQDVTHSSLLTAKKDPKSDLYIVQCDSQQNSDHKVAQFNFIPGMFAAIEVQEALLPDVIVLPTSAISYSLYGNSVFIIEENPKLKDKDDKPLLQVKRVFVETGDQHGNYTIIKKGIRPNQLVVNSGELKLEDGTRVVINDTVALPDTMSPSTLMP